MLRIECSRETVIRATTSRMRHVTLRDRVKVVLILRLSLASRLHRLILRRVWVLCAAISLVLRAAQTAFDLRSGGHLDVLETVHGMSRLLLERVRCCNHLRIAQCLFPLIAGVANLVNALRPCLGDDGERLVVPVLVGILPLRLCTGGTLEHPIDLVVQRCFVTWNRRNFKPLRARGMHLRLSTLPLLGVKVLLLVHLLVIIWLWHHRNPPTAIIKLVLHARMREWWHPRLLLLSLGHVFAHTDKLFDQELEDSVLILGL